MSKRIRLSLISVMATMGTYLQDMVVAPKEQPKKKPIYGNGKTKRTKGKRERSLKSRANRIKAKRKA